MVNAFPMKDAERLEFIKMKKAWKAVVFDLDGTLADTLRDLAEAANAALALSGLSPYPVDEYRFLVGNGVRKLIERAAGINTPPFLQQHILEEFLRIYDRDCLKYVKPYEGMPNTLTSLKNEGIKLLVVTNKPDLQAHKIITELFGNDIFDGIFGNCEGRKTKPDPALTLQALASVDAEPSKSLFIGDSDVDIYTASNAGMISAGAVWGFRGEDELRNAGAVYILHKPEEILNIY